MSLTHTVSIANSTIVASFQTAKMGIMLEVKQAEAAGRIKYVLATEYLDTLQKLVRPGTHAFVGEDLTERVLMAQRFSQTGKAVSGNDFQSVGTDIRLDHYW